MFRDITASPITSPVVSTPPHLRLPAGARAHLLRTSRGPFAVHEAHPPQGSHPRGTALLVPGFTGSKEDFLTVLESLSGAGYEVIAIDQRGQYETPGPDDAEAYSLDALGADLLAIAETTGGPVHLVGHSFGGLAVRQATIAAPEAVASATLLCSGPGRLSGPSADKLETLIGALTMFSVADIWGVVNATAEANGEHVGIAPEVLEFLERRFKQTTAQNLATLAAILLSAEDRTAELAAAGVPTLVLWGATDDVWLPGVQADMAARLGAAGVAIEGAGHSPAVENPVGTAAVLMRFWAGLPTPAKIAASFDEGP